MQFHAPESPCHNRSSISEASLFSIGSRRRGGTRIRRLGQRDRVLFTNLLPMNPEIRPNTIHANIDIICSPYAARFGVFRPGLDLSCAFRELVSLMRQWFEATLSKLSRKSETTVAIRYALSRWDALLRYTDDGHIEIDNNAAERSLRGVALGRNYAQSAIMRSW